jgi:type I restriction enzyme S subunit
LYQQIQKEKQRLIKEGKIKKEKPLPEITEDDKPFDIPETWKWIKLGSLFSIERGSSPRPIQSYLTNDADGVNWIKIGDSEVGAKYITKTSQKITREGALCSRKVEIGDFIVSNSMSFGRPYIMAIEGYVHDGWNIIHLIKAINDQDLFDKEYLYYVLSSNLLVEQMKTKAAGGVVKNIKSDYLKDLILPIPPLAEQKRIVAKLEEILPLCEKLKK